MSLNFLEFEKPINELETKIKELKEFNVDDTLNIKNELHRLEAKTRKLTESIFRDLSSWQISQLARHPMRPYMLDYVNKIFTDFVELHGDRMYSDDQSIVTGLAQFSGTGIAVIGHQKGRNTDEKVKRNFGMPRPEGFRKAQRIMKIAERFQLPLITFIDTPGAYPGIDAEMRGQSEAIARTIALMTDLKIPIISIVTGEGGSGGALALGVCDRLLMLQYSIYSVISPEGCASILWKDSKKAEVAADILKITSTDLKDQNLTDEVLGEPIGGAHRNIDSMALTISDALKRHLSDLEKINKRDMLINRYDKLRSFGIFSET